MDNTVEKIKQKMICEVVKGVIKKTAFRRVGMGATRGGRRYCFAYMRGRASRFCRGRKMSVVDVEVRPCDEYLDLQSAVRDYYNTITEIDTTLDTDTGRYDQERVGQVMQEMYDRQSKMFELIGITHHGGKYENNT